MRQIKISDITLREQAMNPESNLSFKEKIEIAKHLDNLNVDVIDTPPIENEKTDTLLLRTMSSFIKNSTLSVPLNFDFDDVEAAWNAVANAKSARLHVLIPVSPIQMEYFCHKKPPVVLEKIKELITECKKYCDDVEFSAEDATRADAEYLTETITAAIDCGANTITICDSEGSMLPHEMENFITDLYKKIPKLKDVNLGVQCNNDLNMAAACAVSALQAGAAEIKVTVDNTLYPAISDISRIIINRGDAAGVECNLKTTQLKRLIKQISWILTNNNKHNDDSLLHTIMSHDEYENFQMNAQDDIHTVERAVCDLGYDLSEEDMIKVYDLFQKFAKKKIVRAKELDAIVASIALQVPPTYQLESYVINSGNIIAATANIRLEKDGEIISGLHSGDGPIDAAFKAIEQVIGSHYQLEDFQIQSVTEGQEAMGSALVKLSSRGKLYSGNGISTDIIGASIKAYINAINKIVYEEN